METQIRKILTDLGIYSKTKGFFFLIDAIEIYALSDKFGIKITEDIYPVIATRHKTTKENVERAIRYTLTELYKENPTNEYLLLFGDPRTRRKPTNTEFIATAAYELTDKSEIK